MLNKSRYYLSSFTLFVNETYIVFFFGVLFFEAMTSKRKIESAKTLKAQLVAFNTSATSYSKILSACCSMLCVLQGTKFYKPDQRNKIYCFNLRTCICLIQSSTTLLRKVIVTSTYNKHFSRPVKFSTYLYINDQILMNLSLELKGAPVSFLTATESHWERRKDNYKQLCHGSCIVSTKTFENLSWINDILKSYFIIALTLPKRYNRLNLQI
ncbi:hypothetical protein EGR_01064 [Echinococcus granulosus]|uniref:Uncharacterized protein n=1 Tax=Echinococcus granulosus TaxID=6210 RepID=W6UTG2_ECHGR|nr:hypothetical protein EGR_01064 [Echinococcus granulosus]EUB63936.1 hypothetical protein EGR_01064 [Echinococcus granulosus]